MKAKISMRGPKSEWGAAIDYEHAPAQGLTKERLEQTVIIRYKTEDRARQETGGGRWYLVRLVNGKWQPWTARTEPAIKDWAKT